jgi:hypothetical protein
MFHVKHLCRVFAGKFFILDKRGLAELTTEELAKLTNGTRC